MNKTLHKFINPLYLLLWLGLSLFMGINHEPFSDEAQSYLIARDASLKDLLNDVIRTEGHPLLWYLWLKFLQFFGLSYSNLYISSVLPEFLAVGIFIYKAPFSKDVRYLFPLTFYVFYQYNIIARSYSLIFLFIVLIALFYDKRNKFPLSYTILLMLFGEITIHTMLLSGLLFLEWQYENYKAKQLNVLPFVLFTIYGVFNIWLLYPDFSNQYMAAFYHRPMFIVNNIWNILCLPIVSCAKFAVLGNEIYNALSIIFLWLIISEIYEKFHKEFFYWLLPALLVMVFIPAKPWHTGILIMVVLLIFWINSKKKSLSCLGKLLLSVFFAVQLVWSMISIYKEKTYAYSGGLEAFRFLKQNNIDIKETMLVSFQAVSICLYADSPICSYWNWQNTGFNKKISSKEYDKYQALVINKETFMENKDYFLSKEKERNLSLKIIPADNFFATRERTEFETFYIYYKDKEGADIEN